MKLNVIGDIIEVYDDYGKKAGTVVLSRHPATVTKLTQMVRRGTQQKS